MHSSVVIPDQLWVQILFSTPTGVQACCYLTITSIFPFPMLIFGATEEILAPTNHLLVAVLLNLLEPSLSSRFVEGTGQDGYLAVLMLPTSRGR